MKKILILNLLFALIAIKIFAGNLTKDPTFKTSQQVDNIVNYMYFDGVDTKNVLTVYAAGGAPITIDTTDSKINEIIDSLAVLINKHDTITTADTINIVNYAIDYNIDTQISLLLSELIKLNSKHDTLTITNDTVNISNYNIDSNIDTEISLLLVELIKLNSKHDTLTPANDTVNIINYNIDNHIDTKSSLILEKLIDLESNLNNISDTVIPARIFDNQEFVYVNNADNSDSVFITINKISEIKVYEGETYTVNITRYGIDSEPATGDKRDGKIKSITYTKP